MRPPDAARLSVVMPVYNEADAIVAAVDEVPVNVGTIAEDVVAAFRRAGFIDPTSVVSRWHQRLEHGYPTPWLGRDAATSRPR